MASTEANEASATVPQSFLKGPPPSPSITRIDFSQTDLKEYQGLYAVVLDGILTPDECNTFTSLAEAQAPQGWERAMINVGGGRQKLAEETRKCGRIIWDDQEVVNRLWDRIKSMLPELADLRNQPDVTGNGPSMRKEVWKMTRLNERMRFLKYGAGEYFKPHCDGTYETPDRRERTYYTLHLYLNDAEHQPTDEPLKGGATTFWSYRGFNSKRFDVQPKMGSILVFQQRFLLHAGDDLISGSKLTMRTELMYEKADELALVGEKGREVLKHGWAKDQLGV